MVRIYWFVKILLRKNIVNFISEFFKVINQNLRKIGWLDSTNTPFIYNILQYMYINILRFGIDAYN